MQATKPEIAVASAARGPTSGERGKTGNQYGHLAMEVFDRVRPCTLRVAAHSVAICNRGFNCEEKPNETRAVYSTASSGTVVVKSNGSRWEVSEDGKIFHTPAAAHTAQCGKE